MRWRITAAVAAAALTGSIIGHRPGLFGTDVPGMADGHLPAVAAATVDTTSGLTVHRIHYPTGVGHADPNQNWMDLYLPATQSIQRLPLVIVIHGGGWASRIGADSMATLARRIADRGIAVLNIEYRRVGRGGGWPRTFDDVAAAFDDVPHVIARYPRIDPTGAVAVGHSAGAQLAVWASTRHTSGSDLSSRPRFRPSLVFSLAGPLDLRRAAALGDRNVVRALGGSPAQVGSRYARFDPIENLDPSLPVVAITGTRDTTVSPTLSAEYVAADNAIGGHARLILLAGQTHSSIVDPDSAVFDSLVAMIADAALR